MERRNSSGITADTEYDEWLDRVGSTGGEWFKVLALGPNTRPHGPDWAKLDDPSVSSDLRERIAESTRAFSEQRKGFTQQQLRRLAAGATLIRACVYDDDPQALSDPEYRKTLHWLKNSYAQSFAHAEQL